MPALREVADLLRRKEPLSIEQCRAAWATADDARDLFAVVAAASDQEAALGLAACACAREALKALPTRYPVLEEALAVAERWFTGIGTLEQLEAARATVYALYQTTDHDLSFAGEAVGAAQQAVMAATTDPPCGEDVAMSAANAMACASNPVDRDEMRERRRAALRALADVCRAHMTWPS